MEKSVETNSEPVIITMIESELYRLLIDAVLFGENWQRNNTMITPKRYVMDAIKSIPFKKDTQQTTEEKTSITAISIDLNKKAVQFQTQNGSFVVGFARLLEIVLKDDINAWESELLRRKDQIGK